MWCFYFSIGISISFAENTEKDPVISIVSKKRIFKSNWESLVDFYFLPNVREYMKNTGWNRNCSFSYIKENSTDLLVYAENSENRELVSYYKVNKLSGQITYIGEIVDNSNNHRLSGKWRQYPEMFGEFL